MQEEIAAGIQQNHKKNVQSLVSMLLLVFLLLLVGRRASALGSMAPIAASYGEKGRAFCGLRADGSNSVDCYGSDAASVYGAPSRIAFLGLTAGDGFVCGLGLVSRQPYCWGNNAYVQQGVPPSPLPSGAANVSYVDISAGDNHLCALRSWESSTMTSGDDGGGRGGGMVDCWGYNVTGSFVRGAPLFSLTSGSLFSCGLFFGNATPVCWGDDTGSRVLSSAPAGVVFASISAGGYHVCGVVKGSGGRVLCWGRSLLHGGSLAPWLSAAAFSLLVGGKFHQCGLQAANRTALCWGLSLPNATPPPAGARFLSIAAGDYFTCGVGEADLQPVCWGSNYPSSPPSTAVAVVPGLCSPQPCKPGTYRFTRNSSSSGGDPAMAASATVAMCQDPIQDVCLRCSEGCPAGMMETTPCGAEGDRACGFNCSDCQGSQACLAACRAVIGGGSRKHGSIPIQAPIIVGELVLAAIVILLVVVVIVWARNRTAAQAAAAIVTVAKNAGNSGAAAAGGNGSSSIKKSRTVASKKSSFRSSLRRQAEVWAQEELKMAKAHSFPYADLEQATNGFASENEIGRGSFSVVYKGLLSDGRVVAVKKSNAHHAQVKDSKDFHNELDLLSRLNHAHLLNLLGFCDESAERLLVYEFMANGTLHEHLHGKKHNQQQQQRNARQQNGSIVGSSARGSCHSSSSSRRNEGSGPQNIQGEIPSSGETECSPRPPLSWVRRVKIAVQAARGLEYLHGYACPSVIHRDIKSSNILLDDEWNARVADFGLSLLGPADSGQPLSELPAGTLGYLDPEYYRLHYLTPKSDVYSFGVLLLEVLSGRRAIDMRYDEGNVVEWAVPLIKAGKVSEVLDPRLDPPANVDALRKVARVAARCVRMRGRERPAMGKVTTSLERALALLLMGTASGSRLILPTEVVLGSTRLHSKGGSSMRSCSGGSGSIATIGRGRRRSSSEMCCSQVDDEEQVPLDNPVLASLTFPSASAGSSSSKRRDEFFRGAGSSMSESEANLNGNGECSSSSLRQQLEEKNQQHRHHYHHHHHHQLEIGPASPMPGNSRPL